MSKNDVSGEGQESLTCKLPQTPPLMTRHLTGKVERGAILCALSKARITVSHLECGVFEGLVVFSVPLVASWELKVHLLFVCSVTGTPAAVPKLSNAQISEHYSTCIKLSTENVSTDTLCRVLCREHI